MARRFGIVVAGFMLALAASVSRADVPEQSPPLPPHGVRLQAQEKVVIAVDAQGALTIVSRGPTQGDAAVPAPVLDTRIETLDPVKGVPSHAAPGTVAVSFRGQGSKESVLEIENGFDHAVIYDAFIVKDGPNGEVISRTTICPVRAGKVGVEAWPGALRAIIISNIHAPPAGDMRCSGASGLVVDADLAPANICMSGQLNDPVQVRLSVDPASGMRRSAEAIWSLGDPGGGELAPRLLFDFPMQGASVGGRPIGSQVFALAGLQPPPASRTAVIVLYADGREAARRPWRLYAQQRTALDAVPPDNRPIAFVGVVPFNLRSEAGEADPSLVDLFAAVGDGRVRVMQVKIIGDDGADIGHASFSLQPAAIRDSSLVDTALRAAEAMAAEPQHCAKPLQAQRGGF